MRPLSPLAVVAAVTLLVVLGLGLLYAYRAQTPAVQSVPITQGMQEIQSGQIARIDFEGERATLTRTDGAREQVATPNGPSDPLTSTALAYNASHPDRQITIRQGGGPPEFALFPVLVGLLPLLVLVVLVLLAAKLATGRVGDPYERLERIANLRDRGVLSEDEFQREKRRLLK
jgi:ATP-dependent Zn protease